MLKYEPMAGKERFRPQIDREVNPERAEMQKLFVTGHLLPGADISASHVTTFLTELGEVCGMNIFNGPHVKTPDSYDPETFRRLGNRPPEDINGSVMWDDSGAQMYVFPNRGRWFTLDIYTCKQFDNQRALQFVYETLDVGEDMEFAIQTHETNNPWSPFSQTDGKPLNHEMPFVSEIDKLFNIDLANPEQVFIGGARLEQQVLLAVREGSGNRLAAQYTQQQREQLRELHSRFEVLTDERFMDNVLSNKTSDPNQYPFQTTYNRLSLMEARAGNMQQGKQIMHIGTGWPGTAIGLYRQFGIPVLCVEKDPCVAEKSEEALKRLGLLGNDKLRILCADGTTINPQGYNTVIVSAMVPDRDKATILRNLRNLATGTTSDPFLILRSPADSARSLFYQAPSRDLIGNTAELAANTRSFMKPEDPLQSFLYRVKELAEVKRGSDAIIMATIAKLQRPA